MNAWFGAGSQENKHAEWKRNTLERNNIANIPCVASDKLRNYLQGAEPKADLRFICGVRIIVPLIKLYERWERSKEKQHAN